MKDEGGRMKPEVKRKKDKGKTRARDAKDHKTCSG
jgi:hypothetical protein